MSMIRFSWAKTLEILSPFHFKRWFKILIIVSFAGAGIPSFVVNFNLPNQSAFVAFTPRKIKAPKFSPVIRPPTVEELSVARASSSSGASVCCADQVAAQPNRGFKPPSPNPDAEQIKRLRSQAPLSKRKASPIGVAFFIAGMIALGFGSLALLVFFLWLASRLNFVLLNTLVTKDPLIQGPFKQNKEIGDSYFRWSLAFFGIAGAVLMILAMIGVVLLMIAKKNAWLSVLFGIFTVPVSAAIILAVVAIGTLMHDLVVPIMYREKISAMKAIKSFLASDAFSFPRMIQYLLLIFGFWVLATVIQMIIAVFVGLGGLIAGGVVTIPGLVLMKALPFLKIPILILGVFAAICLILAVVMVIGMVMLPAVIFFRVFALAYLAKIRPDCDLLGFSGQR